MLDLNAFAKEAHAARRALVNALDIDPEVIERSVRRG